MINKGELDYRSWYKVANSAKTSNPNATFAKPLTFDSACDSILQRANEIKNNYVGMGT